MTAMVHLPIQKSRSCTAWIPHLCFTLPESLGPGCKPTEQGRLSGNCRKYIVVRVRLLHFGPAHCLPTSTFGTSPKIHTGSWDFFLLRDKLVVSYLKEEGVGIVTQLAQQFPLHLCVNRLLAVQERGVHLAGGHIKLPPEHDANHVHIVSAIAKGAGQRDKR